MTRRLCFLISVASISNPAHAMRSSDITHMSSVEPTFEHGVLVGCVVGYLVSHSTDDIDSTKRTFVSGQIQLRKSKMGPVVFLKVNPSARASKTAMPVAEAYLFNGLKSNVSDFVAAAPDEINQVTAFKAEAATLAAILDAVVQTGLITVGYSLKEAGNVKLFEIDLKTKLGATQEIAAIELDRTAPSRWATCVTELLAAN